MLANISYILQALQSLSICLQTYNSLQTTCLWTYHKFASQLVNPHWRPCKSVPWQASYSQFPLQAHWLNRLMEWHFLVTPMLAREDRCISLLPSLFMGGGFGNFLWWLCLPDHHKVSHINFSINFDSNASWSLQPPFGLYIYNPILGCLLADVAINLHESFDKCEVLSSFKDFLDTATTASGAGAAAFTAFLAFFVLCLTAIMSLAEEYKSLLSHTEEDKGNCPLLNWFSIPTVAALVMPLVAMVLDFMEGGDLTCAHHFNWAFMIPFLKRSLTIILYRNMRQYQLQDLAVASISILQQVLLGAGTLCALRQEIVQDVSGLPNLTGWRFHPLHRPNMKFNNKIVVHYFMIAQVSLILLQLEFGLNGVLQEWENTKIWPK